jgi:hypothetical protein
MAKTIYGGKSMLKDKACKTETEYEKTSRIKIRCRRGYGDRYPESFTKEKAI